MKIANLPQLLTKDYRDFVELFEMTSGAHDQNEIFELPYMKDISA